MSTLSISRQSSELDIKQAITNKLFDAYRELMMRARSGTLADAQRMFGVVLGLRIALMQLNITMGNNAYNFTGSLGIEQLLRDDFGQMKLVQVREYAFPEL